MTTSSPFDCLANELQDMIFSFLGWELRAFIFKRTTSNSARKALWTFYCKDVTPSMSRKADFVHSAHKHVIKPQDMLKVIQKFPTAANATTEAGFCVPSGRIEDITTLGMDTHVTVCFPTAWKQERLRRLLTRLHKMETLTLRALAIPRNHEIPFEAEDPLTLAEYRPITIPTSVRHLVLEECFDGQRVRAHVSRRTIVGVNVVYRQVFADSCSHIHEKFYGSEHLRTLHFKTWYLDRSSLRFICECTALEELRIDLHDIDSQGDFSVLGRLFSKIRDLKKLTVLNVRWPPKENLQMFPTWWTVKFPQLRIFRLPFTWFHRAIALTKPSTNIQFELLLDFDAVVEYLRDTKDAGPTQLPSRKRTLEQKLAARFQAAFVDEYEESAAREFLVRKAINKVKELKSWFTKQREQGLEEKRDVTIVECENWTEMHVGAPWWKEDREDKTFCKSIDAVMASQD